MITRTPGRVPIGGMPPIEKPVRSWASRAVARRMSGDAGDRREPREVDPVVAGDEAQERLARRRGRDDEDQRLDDLAELRAERRGRLGGGVGRLVELVDLERHALARGGIEDALDRGMDGGVGHGRSLASGHAGRIGRAGVASRPWTRSSSPTATRRPAPSSIAPGPAGTRRSGSSSRPTAARATQPALGRRDRPVGRRRRLDRRGRAGRARGGGRADRTVAAGQGRIGHRAGRPGGLRPGSRRRARSSAPWAARIDHALANVGLLAMPELAGREAAILDARSRIALDQRARAGWRRRSSGRCRAGRATSSRCCRSARRRGRHDARPGLPARRRAAPRRAGPRAVERPARRPTRRSPSGAACCSSWSRLLRFEP